MALYCGAYIHAVSGKPATATTHANRALWLSPFDPFAFMAYAALGAAAVQEAHYDEAASHFAKAAQANPRFSTPISFRSRRWR
jgi:adenylate cyclase